MKKIPALLLFSLGLIFCSCKSSYEIVAVFDNVEGLTTGSDVSADGLKVGKVSDMELSFKGVNVTMAIEDKYKIPQGSSFWISRPLLGKADIHITLGHGRGNIREGDTIKAVQMPEEYSALTREKLDTIITSFVKAVEHSEAEKKEKQ